MPRITIKWGEYMPDEEKQEDTFNFKTDAEAHAFLMGVGCMDGWSGYEVVEEVYEADEKKEFTQWDADIELLKPVLEVFELEIMRGVAIYSLNGAFTSADLVEITDNEVVVEVKWGVSEEDGKWEEYETFTLDIDVLRSTILTPYEKQQKFEN